MQNNKPLPKGHPLHEASKELISAVDFYRKMIERQIGDFASFDSAWREFLQKLERVWNKAQAGVHEKPGWKTLESQFVKLRTDDPLLSYLRHARNADEHSLQQVSTDWNANLRVSDTAPGSVRVEWDPWDRPLLPVRNRGVTYNPPREHLGQSIEDRLKKGAAEPVVLADLALHFYRNMLDRIIIEILERDGSGA